MVVYDENQSPRNRNEKNRIIKDLSRVEADDGVVVVVGVIVDVLVVVEAVVEVEVVVEVVVVVGFV